MPNLTIGSKAIPFSLPGVDDQEHSLADYTDKKAVVVFFTCNHCPYVRAWEDRMVQLQAEYAAKGVQLIAINSNTPSPILSGDLARDAIVLAHKQTESVVKKGRVAI